MRVKKDRRLLTRCAWGSLLITTAVAFGSVPSLCLCTGISRTQAADGIPDSNIFDSRATQVIASDMASNDEPTLDEGPLLSANQSEATSTTAARKVTQPPVIDPEPFFTIQPTTPLRLTDAQMAMGLFGIPSFNRSILGESRRGRAIGPSTDIVLGSEAKTLFTTDAGSLLRRSRTTLGIGVQRRTPIVNDPRVRGSRVGQLAASGSYWVPARIDLDTMLSKIDSRIVDNMIVIKGPYSVLYGPGFNFIDLQLLSSPRYDQGSQLHGSTSLDYVTNGQQWYGRQSVWGGDEDWGFRLGYGHRTGNDYVAGDAISVPSGYRSRDWDLALGLDLSPVSHIEFNYLRLDQTDVEFPGQAFDMDYLVTDGFELEYVSEHQQYYDRFVVDTWYNRTRFEGNAQGEGKRDQFPILNFINYIGFTDVDAASVGFRAAMTWGDEESTHLTAGIDLRQIKQELNEIGSGTAGFNAFQDANSPIPRSRSVNPGIFIEMANSDDARLQLKAGIRGDLVSADVIDDPAKLSALGNQPMANQSSLAEILGSDEFDQSFSLWSAFLTSQYEINSCWTLKGGVGYAQRPPSLTELYVAQSFLFLLQNGLNTATGDPTLAPERLYQIDLGLSGEYGAFRAGIQGFHAWINDYITFENLSVVAGPPGGDQQVNLKYVNTGLATLAGGELYGEWDATSWITAFGTMTYVEGRDHTRNGDFTTSQAAPGNPSKRFYGFIRGYISGVGGNAEEPLPSISPLESRLGIRVHEPGEHPRWGLELAIRIVDNQDRVAVSLLETPTPGFAVLDLRSYWQLTRNLYFVAGVENIGNRTFREHLDFRSPNGGFQIFQPGTSGYFGAELTY